MFRRRGGYQRLSTTATATVDTDANSTGASRENPGTDRSRYASEISSSLPLQILLYYNGLFSAAYLVLEGGLITEKVGVMTHTHTDRQQYCCTEIRPGLNGTCKLRRSVLDKSPSVTYNYASFSCVAGCMSCVRLRVSDFSSTTTGFSRSFKERSWHRSSSAGPSLRCTDYISDARETSKRWWDSRCSANNCAYLV